MIFFPDYPIITIQMSSTRSAIVFAHIYQVKKGQNTTFSCNADSNPLPASITWSGRVNSTTGQLRIIAAEAGRHNGVYTCTVVTKTVDDDERLPLKASRRLIIDVKGMLNNLPSLLTLFVFYIGYIHICLYCNRF